MTAEQEEFARALDRFRRLLAYERYHQATKLVPLVGRYSHGQQELTELLQAVDRFGLIAPHQRWSSDGTGYLQYGPPLFARDDDLETKLQVVMHNTPPILRLPRWFAPNRIDPQHWLFRTLVQAEFPLPYCEFPIGFRRTDFAYPEWHLAIEVDGPSHDETSDRQKDLELADAGWKPIRIRLAEIDSGNELTLAETFRKTILEESLGRGADFRRQRIVESYSTFTTNLLVRARTTRTSSADLAVYEDDDAGIEAYVGWDIDADLLETNL